MTLSRSGALCAIFALGALSTLAACGDKDGDDTAGSTESDTDTDADSDTDSDADSDADSDTDSDSDTDADTDADADADAYRGGVEVMYDYEHEGEVRSTKAFSYTDGSDTIIFVSTNSDATCDQVALYLGYNPNDPKPADPVDPTDLTTDGYCNTLIAMSTGSSGTVNLDESTAALVTINCFFDGTAWNYETVGDQTGYFYDGSFYQGTAEDGIITMEVSSSGGSFTVDERITTVGGLYPQDTDAPSSIKARTNLKGELTSENCDTLRYTDFF